MDEISLSECNCPVEEYINGEDDIPICIHYDDDWENHFFAEIGTSQANSESLLKMITKKKNSLTLSRLLKLLQSFKMQSFSS